MTVDQHRRPAAENSSAPRRPGALLAAGLTFANLLVTFWGLMFVLDRYGREFDPLYDYLLPQEIWAPMLVLILAQAAVNGLLLLPWRATRRAGLGVLVGAIAAAVGLLAFFVIFVFFVGAAWA